MCVIYVRSQTSGEDSSKTAKADIHGATRGMHPNTLLGSSSSAITFRSACTPA